MKKPTHKIYRTTNWPAYNRALIHRGNIAIWFDPARVYACINSRRLAWYELIVPCFKFNVQSDGAFLRAIPFDLENPEKIMTYISDLC